MALTIAIHKYGFEVIDVFFFISINVTLLDRRIYVVILLYFQNEKLTSTGLDQVTEIETAFSFFLEMHLN